MTGPVPALESRARSCATRLLEADRVLLASHIDADGLTSAAIAASALERAAIPFETVFEKQLDPEAIASIAASPYDTVLFTDFGSGQLDDIGPYEDDGAFTPIIADHHQPADRETPYHLNPLLFGIDGASELSGAGTTYVLARALASVCRGGADRTTDRSRLDTPSDRESSDRESSDRHEPAADGGVERDAGDRTTPNTTATDGPPIDDNRDLAALAVVGAVGDMQASGGELHGANAAIVAEGADAGVVETATDLSLYGKQTRPLPKLLEYASDVRIPGITNDASGTLRFLDGLDLETKRDGEWRRWCDLTADEKQRLASALVRKAVSAGVPPGSIESLVGTSYTLCNELEGTELRDASEFSTLLNATARYDRADVGLAVCLGNRDEALDRARTLLRDHRRNLSAGIDLITSDGVTQEDHLQWFHAGDQIRETIVGIVAGMAVGNPGISRRKPILAFAEKRDAEDEVKVSARGTHALVREGLDLSVVVGTAARAVDGDGGGHDVAAGATVPSGEEPTFVELADELVGDQLE